MLALIGVIGGLALVSDDGLIPVANAQGDLVYVPLASPCRVVNTRNTASTHLIATNSRDFFSFGPAGTIGAQGGNLTGCDHPRSGEGWQPAAIAANVTAVGKQASGNGNITAYPAGSGAPGASTVNYTPAANIANSTLITLRMSDGNFTLLSNGSNVPAVVDVVGYFYPLQGGELQVDCATQSLQAAIETAPLHGKTVITISGACSDDIFVRRNITIQGSTGPSTDSITGDLSGFSSDPLDGYDLPALGGALVQKNLSAAVQLQSGKKLSLKNMTVNAGINNSAVITGTHSSIDLNNVTLVGGPNGLGLHIYKSSAYLTDTTILGVGGGAFVAEMNSTVEFKDNNTITGGDTGANEETTAFVAISNTAVKLNGSGNTFNAGLAIGVDDDTLGVEILVNSSLLQFEAGVGNQINGSFGIFLNAVALFEEIGINNGNIEIGENSTLFLNSQGAITMNGITEVAVSSNSKLTLDDSSPITINSGGVAGVMRVEDHSTVHLFGDSNGSGASLVNMDVELLSSSSINGDRNSKIGGNLEVSGFSTYQMTGQVGTSVSGTVTCFKGEAFDFTAAAPGTAIPLGSCL